MKADDTPTHASKDKLQCDTMVCRSGFGICKPGLKSPLSLCRCASLGELLDISESQFSYL